MSSLDTDDKSLYKRRAPDFKTKDGLLWGFQEDTHGTVYSHRLSYFKKVRKGGDFFYGKSGNENHVEGV